MIEINVQAYCLSAGKTYTGPEGEIPIKTSYGLFHACKLKSPTMASQIWKGAMVKIGLPTIEALCIGLNCTPAEIFKITPPVTPGVPGRPAVKAKASRAQKEAAQARVMKIYKRGSAPQVGSVGALSFGRGKKKGGKKTGKKSKG